MEIHIGKSKEQVIKEVAGVVESLAQNAVRDHGRFTWALSGGSSPKALFSLLSSDYKESFPWDKTLFFFGDERYVALDHPDSNYLMAKTTMLEVMGVADEQIFAVNTALSPADAARDYQERMVSAFQSDSPAFDLVLLGLGDDAHTASLFPGTDVLENSSDLVSDVFLPQKDVYRITFTKSLINHAHTVAFLTFGENKADAVRQVFTKEGDYTLYPAQLINPESGDLRWYIDEAAASGVR